MDFARQREQLVRRLRDEGHVASSGLLQALSWVPRELFLPPDVQSHAYEDHPLPIGHGQTMSAPHMVAIICEALDLGPGLRVLEVGTGSGYHAAVTSRLVAPGGRVVSVEWVPELVLEAQTHLQRAGVDTVQVIQGDGGQGHPPGSPYDRIYLTCAAPRVPPPLIDQLQEGGVLLAPLGRDPSELVRVRKTGGVLTDEKLGPCSFVPLMGEFGDPS